MRDAGRPGEPGTGDDPGRRGSGWPGPPSPGSLEPGGRGRSGAWLRERGPRRRCRRPCCGGRGPLPDAAGAATRRAGLRARARPRPTPSADLAAVARGWAARFVCPGDAGVAGASSTTSATRAPSGCGCAGGPPCGCGHCARSPWSAPGPAPTTAPTWPPRSAPDSPSAGWIGGLRRRLRGRRRRAPGRARGGRRHRRRARLRGRPSLSARAHRVDRRSREQGLVVGELPPGDHPTRSRFVLRNRVIAALTRGTVVVEAAATAAARWSPRGGRRSSAASRMGVPGPVHQRPVRRACTNCCAARRSWSPTPPKSSNWSAASATTSAPERRGPVLPRDLLDPVAAARPGRAAGAAAARRRPASPRTPARGLDDTLGKLLRTACPRIRRTGRPSLAVVARRAGGVVTGGER